MPIINFTQIFGASGNNGNSPPQTVPVPIPNFGTVTISGGNLFTGLLNAPADEGTLYFTAAPGVDGLNAPGYMNPITIAFPQPVADVALNVLNGLPVSTTYTIADNIGRAQRCKSRQILQAARH
jgi:hypothetical protein